MVPYDKVVPHSALYIDMTYSYLAKVMWQFFSPSDRRVFQSQLEKVCLTDPGNEKLIVSASVRTATDLLFQALNWPLGSELIMTGVNIPQMTQVVRYHGVVPIPIELDQGTLGIKLDDIKGKVSPRTKGIMISYIFGAKFDVQEIIEWCHSQGIYIIEDQAESFQDPKMKIHPKVDFATFSFGTIKTCSAFGGAISIVKNNEVIYRKMVAIQDKYPFLTKYYFFKKIAKNTIPILLLNYPKINQGFRWATMNYFPFDYKEAVVNSIRGFSVQEEYLETFRVQLPTPQMALLALRLTTFDRKHFAEATKRQIAGQNILLQNGIIVPGHKVETRNFWLYPIIVPNPELTYKMLNARGVDAYMGVTQLDIVESPIGSKFEYPNKTLDYFKNVLFLPIHQMVPPENIQRICKEVIDVVDIIKRQDKPRL